MEEYILDGEVHRFEYPSEWFYAGVVLDKPLEFTIQDETFTEISEKLIDKYFEHLRRCFNPLSFHEDFQMIFRPAENGQPATLGIKFK